MIHDVAKEVGDMAAVDMSSGLVHPQERLLLGQLQ